MKWLVLVLALSACKSDSARKADHAAREVKSQRGDLAKAEEQFEARRRNRVADLDARRAVMATQPMLISTLATNLPLTDDARTAVNEKLVIFQMRLDDMKNQLETLRTSDASRWQQLDDAVAKAMEKLETARQDAWKSLENAPRTSS